MKKQLLTIVALLFAAITAMAQVELGAPQWNIKDGAKVSLNKVISLAFPNATGVTAESTISIAGNLYPADEEQGSDPDFDGLEASIANPVDIVLTDILDEVQEKTTYNLVITSVLVDGAEQLADGETLSISFTTRGGERKLSWNFATAIDASAKELIEKHIAEEAAKEEAERNPVWATSGDGAKARFQYLQALNEDELCLPDGTPLAYTEGLYITTKASQLLVPQSSSSTSVLRLHLAKANTLLIPDCKEGDKITLTVNYVDTKSAYYIQIPGAISESATNEAKDSLATPKNKATYQFTVLQDGDLTIKVGNSCIYSIDIVERTDVNPKYSVVAKDPQGNIIKTYVEETEGEAGDLIKGHYSYWLKTAKDSLVTYGSIGSEMSYVFTLSSDTTFVIQYKSTGIGNVKYLMEAEDLVNQEDPENTVQLLTTGNEAVRASMGKAAYASADTKLVTLPAGDYKVDAIVWDKTKGGGNFETIKISDDENDNIFLATTSDNASRTSDVITLATNTDIVWAASGSTQKGIDIICIYDYIVDADAVASVEAAEAAAPATRKVVKNGQLLIETANGTFTVAGAQVK